MKKDPSVALQKGVYDTLTTAMAPVKIYDSVPPGALFPYLTIGDDQLLDDIAECIDGAECYATINIWSRKGGKTEAKQLSKKAITALYDYINLTDFRVCEVKLDGLTHMNDPDGITAHSVITMCYLIEPTT